MERWRVCLFPVRRRLALAAIFWLAGVALGTRFACPVLMALVLCALLALAAVLCRRRRRSALFVVLLTAMLLGSTWTGIRIGRHDAATSPGAELSGTVAAKLSDRRVLLTDVRVEGGQAPSRPVLVTLMLGEGEERTVSVGQRVSGKGRLFAQRETRNPGGVDERIRALCAGYELSGYVLPGWTAQGEARFSPRELLRLLREALLERIDAVFGDAAPTMRALLLGQRQEMVSEVVSAMRLTGTAHVLAVSGLHLSLIAVAIERLLRALRVRRQGRFAALAVILGFYTALTGGAPGTVRALLMALLRAWAPCRGRRYDPLTALAFAATVITAVNPAQAMNAAFQFSFLVVLGVQLVSGAIAGELARVRGRSRTPGALARTVGVSVSAQLAAVPMTLRLYGYAPLLALPMNLLCGACIPAVMLGGWAALLAGCIHLPAGQTLGAAVALPVRLFERLSVAAASVEGAAPRLPAPYAATVLLCALLMMLLSDRIRMGRGRRRAALLCAALIAASYAFRFCPIVRYVQLDVGQGDSAVLRSGRSCVLIDVGPDDSYDALRYLRSEGLNADAVVLTHADADHAGALSVLLRSEVRIGEIILPAETLLTDVSAQVREGLALAQRMGVPVRSVSRGDVIGAAGFALEVLSPDETLAGDNERSLVLMVEAAGTRLLLTGDLPSECEREDMPDCDVLKVAHHGSKNATSLAFLERVTPELALISVGAGNRYGHPTQRVLSDLAQVGARVLRTDTSGCITLWLRVGKRLVQTFL
ncbi:MAG: DNA internalization-related competence protein ComEC/Rec2 [Clostridiales bacterium]|nr:DNA internalization-related competence protein ComEC/Rec2 [Clostridiales bacterium]